LIIENPRESDNAFEKPVREDAGSRQNNAGKHSRLARSPRPRTAMVFDQSTLVTVATSITGLLGVFLLVLWLQERSMRALAWWGGAYLLGAFAVTLWGEQERFSFITPELPNALLFVACGTIWNGARLFQGRAVLPGGLFGGAAVWLILTQYEGLVASEHTRTVLSSLLIAPYAFLTAFELRRERRRDLARRWFWVAIPLLHAAVFLAPIAQIVLLPTALSPDRLFALFAFETVTYVLGTAFVIVVIAKERVAQVHKTAAMTDPLTGLFNRRAFLDAANRLIEQHGKKRRPISVLLFDLDTFKSINDRFGHAVGDETLKTFATIAQARMRASDVIGRIGGEEFAAILSADAAEAGLVADRLRLAFQAAGVAVSGHRIGATVSVGVMTAIAPAPIDVLLAQADAALYRAKRRGRNRIEFSDGTLATPVPGPHEARIFATAQAFAAPHQAVISC
jgi:diguanylate cyclase (GGDEF)-like protein